MNIKHVLLIIPSIFIPYILLGALVVIFFSTKNDICRFIIENMFFNNGLLLLLCVLLYVVFAVVLCVIFVIMSFARGWDPLSIAKAAMTVKIIQIPAYIAIFVLGVLLAITLFTMPFVILLLISNVVTLILSGALVITSVVLSVKKYKLDTSDAVLYIVLQFVFCADVVAAAMWCARLKRIAVSEEN